MAEQIVLGIDPGLRYSGYALLKKEHGSISPLDYGCLALKSSDHLSIRIHQFYDFCQKKIADHMVTHIALETPFLGKNAQTFLKLGYLRGILYLLAEQHGCTLSEFPPRQIKTAFTGYGGASKEQVAIMVGKLFGKLSLVGSTMKNDVTDALAVALCGAWRVQ